MSDGEPMSAGPPPGPGTGLRRAGWGAVAGCLGFAAGFGVALALVRDLGDALGGGGAGADGLFGMCLLGGLAGAVGGWWLGTRAADRAG